MAKELEVFRDMALRVPAEQRPAVRAALISFATPPWSFDEQRSAESKLLSLFGEVLLFRREASASFPAAGLTVLGNDEGYEVPNIVPLSPGALNFREYNAVLEDFRERVASPVAVGLPLNIEVSNATQDLEDWTSADAATALELFSAAANKASGASHPMDEKRWFRFLVADYRGKKRLGAARLMRWLHEVEGWNEDTAHKLASQYEMGIDLLEYLDQH